MSDKKHIDRLFQEKFKDFEKTPNDAVWSNIETKLNEKKKRRIIPIWWRYAGVAALLLLLLTVGNKLYNPSSLDGVEPKINVVDADDEKTRSILETETDKNAIKKSENNRIDNSVIANTNLIKTASDENELEKTSSKNIVKSNVVNNIKQTSVATNLSSKNKKEAHKNNSLITNQSQKSKNINSSNENTIAHSNLNETVDKTKVDNSQSSQIVINKTEKTITNKSNTIASVKTDDATTNNDEDLVEGIVKKDSENKTETIEEAIAKNTEATDKKEHLNRWSVAPNAAPVYFNSLGEGSSIASQFNNNSKTGEVNMSYGINASYAINKKLIIRSGINRVNLGYNTNNVAVFDRVNATAVKSLASLKDTNDAAVINNAQNSNIQTDVALISGETVRASTISPEAFSTASSANINQSLGFIEVPIEFQYIVSDKKLGVNVIGGFSSFFLNNNELFSETNSSRTLIGEAVNVNEVSYSANFGLGLNYKMTKKFNLNFEPMFKYQINTFNNTTGDFKPYFIGVYTGIGFKF